MKKTALAILMLVAAPHLTRADGSVNPGTKSGTGSGRILLLHYRWHKDSLRLIDKEWVRGAVKPVRGASKDAADPVLGNAQPPRSPFSYELVSADGAPLSVVFLQEPGVRRVETQEKGESQLRQHERKVDSSDIFLRVTDPDAKTIRFYRHKRGEARKKAPTTGGTDGGDGSGSAASGTATASETNASKTLLAEFPLE
jgi:hypothetical protein